MSAIREIRLPALSATMEEAILLAWKVGVGDQVTEGQAIAEVSTDKVDMDLEAPFSGVIETLAVEPGETVALGATIATARTESEDLLGGLDFEVVDTQPPPAPEASTVSSIGAAEAGPPGIVPASPPARKLARQMGIDLSDISPTGARGQVTPADVQRHADGRRAPEPEAVRSDDPKRAAVRRATVDIMTRSAAIPQFTLYRTLLLDRVRDARGGRSWTTELVRAMAATLRSHPEMNARWDEESQATTPTSDIVVGLAVDRPGVGLVVATITDPDLADPDEVDQRTRALADRARTGKLRPEDLAQPSITLSNLGGFGVDRFNALLFPPQATILSVGAIKQRPIATGDGALKSALTCEVGLTVDHRVADGADGARFLKSLSDAIEQR